MKAKVINLKIDQISKMLNLTEADLKKPAPKPTKWSQPYWDAAREHRLVFKTCSKCGNIDHPPYLYCTRCHADEHTWVEHTGRAVLLSYSINCYQVPFPFWADMPYVTAFVLTLNDDQKLPPADKVDFEAIRKLEATRTIKNVMMLTTIVDCDPENLINGMELEVVFDDHSVEGFTLPKFRPKDEKYRVGDARYAVKGEGGPKVTAPKATAAKKPEVKPEVDEFAAGYETIIYNIDGSICTISLNRPEKRNAINRKMAAELLHAFRKVRNVPEVGVVVFSGEGKAFCTGGDLSIFPSLAEHQSSINWLAHDGADIIQAIRGCEKVVIGKIQGHCLAGGLELALCCDLLYANESALFGVTEINMGILPGWGGTVQLPRSMPVYRARELLYSGRKDYTAREMYDMGFLTRVFKDDEFDQKFGDIVKNIGAKKPIALRMGKEVMGKSLECGSLDAALAVERNAIQWLIYSPDIQDALAAYKK
jgi:enoyl-CoA hydratase/carnithine racemase/uncharacterized OB-fold protein